MRAWFSFGMVKGMELLAIATKCLPVGVARIAFVAVFSNPNPLQGSLPCSSKEILPQPLAGVLPAGR